MGIIQRWRQRGVIRERELALTEKRLAVEARLVESFDITTSCVDPADALRDPETGQLWDPLGSLVDLDSHSMIINTQALQAMRKESRLLAARNPFAINGHENRVNYVVGTGHSYMATAKPGSELARMVQSARECVRDFREKRYHRSESTFVYAAEYREAVNNAGKESLATVQAVIDEFVDDNQWHRRQQEILLRKDRDGECFLRFFANKDGPMRVRFVEPAQVETPQGDPRPHATFGIVTDQEDVETIESYYVDSVLVDASEIQHRKANVDGNVKRGLSLFYPVRRNLHRAETLLKNMSIVAGIQSAIALIRRHEGGGKSAHEAARASRADVTVTNSTTGKTTCHQRYGAGAIIDAPMGAEYDFPAQGIDAGRFVAVLQAELRAISSRLVMPEFMLSSDASNANYSSTMVAEGPAVKMFERLQWSMIQEDLEVMDRVLDMAVVSGRLDKALRDQVVIDVTPPPLASRNRKEEVEADRILVQEKAMSIQTFQLKNELDPEHETELIDAQREKMDPFPTGGFGQLPGGLGGDGDPEKPTGTGETNEPQ